MTFTYPNLLPIFICIFCIFVFLINRHRTKYFNLVQRFFFRKMSRLSLLSFAVYILGFLLLFLSLADLRGKAQKIESSIPDQKTIVVIDASASMLVEDVRPNRFKKSLMMARHFVKRSAGHQISVVLFSDTQRKLIPFTDDIDLLDAKIAGLEGLDITRGGSNISLAIKESVQYFLQDSGDKEVKSGNILVFTDSEENELSGDINIPEHVNLAVVGVGTLKGGPIPMRSKAGGFRGYKKFNGERVTSKLDENFLKSLEGKISSYKYWIVQSYNLPTEDILDFFRVSFESKLSKGSSIIRPVKQNVFLIPFVILFFIAGLLKQLPSMKHLVVVILLIPFVNTKGEMEEGSETEKPAHIIELENEILKGNSEKRDYLKLAQEYLKTKEADKSRTLYDERLDFEKASTDELINYSTSLLKSKKVSEGLDLLAHIKSTKELSEEQYQKISENVLLALNKKEQEKKKDKNKDKEKDQKEEEKKKGKEEKKEENQSESKKGKQEQKKSSDQQKKPGETKDQDEEKSKKEKDKEKEEKDKDKNAQKNKQQPKSVKDREKEIKKRRKMTKIPAALKQVLDDDRKLQKRKLERIRNSKSKDRTRKDW